MFPLSYSFSHGKPGSGMKLDTAREESRMEQPTQKAKDQVCTSNSQMPRPYLIVDKKKKRVIEFFSA
jgi:hypothetical protein